MYLKANISKVNIDAEYISIIFNLADKPSMMTLSRADNRQFQAILSKLCEVTRTIQFKGDTGIFTGADVEVKISSVKTDWGDLPAVIDFRPCAEKPKQPKPANPETARGYLSELKTSLAAG